jgi:hypothetical protein
MGIYGQTMGCMFLFTEDCPDLSIPALEYASFGSVPYKVAVSPHKLSAYLVSTQKFSLT